MNWLAVVVVGYVLTGLELGLRPFLAIGRADIAPYFVLPLAIFVALSAPASAALWTALGLGLVVDLTSGGLATAASMSGLAGAGAGGSGGVAGVGGGGAELGGAVAVGGAGLPVIVIGPHALGFVVAAALTLTLRGVLFRRNPLTMAVLTVLGGALAGVTAVAVLTLRHAIYPSMVFSPGTALGSRMASSLYSGVSGLMLALALRPMSGLFGFVDPHSFRYGR